MGKCDIKTWELVSRSQFLNPLRRSFFSIQFFYNRTLKDRINTRETLGAKTKTNIQLKSHSGWYRVGNPENTVGRSNQRSQHHPTIPPSLFLQILCTCIYIIQTFIHFCRSATPWPRAPPHAWFVCKLQQRSSTSHRQRKTDTCQLWHDV